MKKIIFAGSICFLLAGTGLEMAPPAVSEAMPSEIAQITDDNIELVPNRQPQVELLDPGQGQRQELRLQPTADTQQTITMTMEMDISTAVSGQPAPAIAFPASVMTMDVAVTQVDPNGDIHYQFTYTDADIVADPNFPPAVLNSMRSAMEPLIGLSGTYVVNPRGIIKSANVDIPEQGDPMTQQMLEQFSNSLDQFSSPLPEEAVGIGAKWRVSSSPNIGGMELNQTTTYELVDLQDNVATLKVNVEQQAGSQAITPPGMPEGMGATVTLESLDSEGQGEMILPLDRIMPTRSNISIRSGTVMNVKPDNSDREATVTTNMSMQVRLDSGE
jgi:hypothetical protein